MSAILELLQPLEAKAAFLVKRSRELLEPGNDHFTVMERDGTVVAWNPPPAQQAFPGLGRTNPSAEDLTQFHHRKKPMPGTLACLIRQINHRNLTSHPQGGANSC